MPLVPLATQTRPGSEAYSGERVINYFAQQADGVTPLVLLARGGLTATVTLPGRVRALVVMDGSLYAAANGKVWKITGGTATDVGTITDGVTSMAASVDEVAIVVGGVYYVCDGSTTTSYATGAVTSPSGVEYMDGYFVVTGTISGRGDAFTISGLDDGTTFNALDFAFAEESADAITAVLRDHDRLWLFGTRTTQIFANSGGVDFPFTPIAGALIEHGCQAQTPAKADNTVFWVRPDGTVMRSGGAEPAVISTPEIKNALAGSTLGGCFTFSERGHEFYCITRDGATSLVFDISTGAWAERTTGLAGGAWAAEVAETLGGTTYFGCNGGQIATAAETTYTDFGGVLLREVVSKPIQQGGNRKFIVRQFHVFFSGGTVNIGRTPQVMMQVSRDGRTFGMEKRRDLGNLGEYHKRATWNARGMFLRGQVKIKVTDPVPADIVGAEYV